MLEPASGWRALDWRELWEFRELAAVLVRRDVRVRYRQTLLGAGWAILRPFLAMIVFSGVFGGLAGLPSEGFPYPVWVYAGLLPWSFFAAAVAAAGGSLLASSHLVTKVYFPRLLLPLAALGTPAVDLAVAAVVLVGLVGLYGVGFGWGLAVVPVLVLLLAAMALGFGLLVAALSVTYRDLQQLLPFLLQLGMFVSPVVYPPSLVPEAWRWVLWLNPMTGLIEAFRGAFLDKPIETASLGISIAAALLLLGAGVVVFKRFERRFADLI